MKNHQNRMNSLLFLSLSLLPLAVLFAGNAAAAATLPDDDKITFGSEQILSDADMDINRGSGGTVNTVTVASNQTISSTSTGNTLDVSGNLTNGSITNGGGIGGSGFGSYVMNTGNNSTINSGVSVSILMLQR